MAQVVVIGSGPGGASAAVALAKQGHSVTILERGRELDGPQGKGSLGQLLNSLKHLKDFAPYVAGGGSAINYGVLATPTLSDVVNAVGPKVAPAVSSHFNSYMKDVGTPQATVPSVGTAHRQVAHALQVHWNIEEATDQALDAKPPQTMRLSNENTLLYNASAQPLNDFRRHQLSLALRMRSVTLWTNSNVEWIEETESGWLLHILKQEQSIRVQAHAVIIACGALETPRLLLASVTRGGMPRGVSEHVGQHLIDHGRNEVSYNISPGFATSRYSTLPFLASKDGTTVEAIHYTGIEACSICSSMALSQCSGIRLSRLIDCIPSCCLFDASFSDATFDPFCCAPCGIASSFNPCRCCVADRMLFVVGHRASIEGSVLVDFNGKRITELPKYSDEDASKVKSAIMAMHVAFQKHTTCLTPSQNSTRFRRTDTDTQWHYGGTARMSVDGDGAVSPEFQPLDRAGRPYSSIYVADASVMRTLTTFNTQTMAALLGYCSGSIASSHMQRE